MKVDPLNILINEKFNFDKKFYLISGNEISLINDIKQRIVNDYKERGWLSKSKDFGEIVMGSELFDDKKYIT